MFIWNPSPVTVLVCIAIVIAGLSTTITGFIDTTKPEVNLVSAPETSIDVCAGVDEFVDLLMSGQPELKNDIYNDGVVDMDEVNLIVQHFAVRMKMEGVDELIANTVNQENKNGKTETSVNNIEGGVESNSGG